MSVEVFPAVALSTVSGVGPYAVPFSFSAEDHVVLRVFNADGTSEVVDPADWMLTPSGEVPGGWTGGTILLDAAAATALAGRQIRPERISNVEQGWAARAGNARERALETQIDWLTRGIQELNWLAERSLRTRDPAQPFVPQADATLVFDADGNPKPGPTSTAIAAAQGHALTASDMAAIAAAQAALATAEANRAALEATRANAARRAFFDTPSDLIADDNEQVGYLGSGAVFEVEPGDFVQAGVHWYRVLSNSAPLPYVATAGGVRLMPVVGQSGQAAVEAFGALLNGTTDDTAAFQLAFDTLLPLSWGKGEALISDTLLIEPGACLIGAGSVANYSFSQSRLKFQPATKRDVFAWKTPKTGYTFAGVTLMGFTIRGFGPGASYCINLPYLYDGKIYIHAYAGVDGLFSAQQWMKTWMRGGVQGFRTYGGHFVNPLGSTLNVTTTMDIKLYVSHGPIGYKLDDAAAFGFTVYGTVESCDHISDTATGNVVNFEVYHENTPRTDAGAAYLIGKSGASPAYATRVGINVLPGIGSNAILTPANTLFADIDVARYVRITGYPYNFNSLIRTTVNTQRVLLIDLDTDNLAYISPIDGIADWSKITMLGFRPRFMQRRGDGYVSEWALHAPDLEFAPIEPATILRRRVAVRADTNKMVRRDLRGNTSLPIGALGTAVTTGHTFLGGNLVPGEMVAHTATGAGLPAFWRSGRHTRDTGNSLGSCSTTSGSAVISRASGFAAIEVNDWVTVSAGYPSATTQYRVIAKASDNSTITLDTNATSSVAGTVTVATEAHQLTPVGQQGMRTFARRTPQTFETPQFVGERAYCSTSQTIWEAISLTTSGWVYVGCVPMVGTVVVTAATIAAGASITATVTVTGAALQDPIHSVAFGGQQVGLYLHAHVTSANTVTVLIKNETASPITTIDATLRVEVRGRTVN